MYAYISRRTSKAFQRHEILRISGICRVVVGTARQWRWLLLLRYLVPIGAMAAAPTAAISMPGRYEPPQLLHTAFCAPVGAPGGYEFQVMAANENGVWSKANAVLRFRMPPLFYQRFGFKIGAGAGACLLLSFLFFLRLNQLHKRYRREVDARHAERERFARDIHDTLLQGVQALLFRLQMWEDDAQVPESLRTEIATVARQTKSVVLEGRERILTIRRTDAQSSDLAEALRMIGHEAADAQMLAFKVEVTGDPITLTVQAEEQLLDIAREAVRNACLHAMATQIIVALEFRRRSLSMIIADDGQGFDPRTAEEWDQTMHFGLLGMRERAGQLGARFRLRTWQNLGTRVEVIVPAKMAFPRTFRWPWQGRSVPPKGTTSLQPTKS